jgi:hypothetical protein
MHLNVINAEVQNWTSETVKARPVYTSKKQICFPLKRSSFIVSEVRKLFISKNGLIHTQEKHKNTIYIHMYIPKKREETGVNVTSSKMFLPKT